MTGSCCNTKLALGGLLCLSLLIAVSVASEECDKSKCKGPLRYYEELKCKPIYKNPGDCCATAYDCSHLLERSSDKCYVNGHVYELGERLRDEDRINPCDLGCFCSKDNTGVGKFVCAIVDCFPKEAKPGCYLRRKLDSCCKAEEICPEKPEDRLKCEVDGKTYYDAERFFPKGDSALLCQCMEGYKGENVEPFCRVNTCGLELKRMPQIRKNCAPIYDNDRSPSKTCNSFFRCQNDNDTIIHPEGETPDVNDQTCKYGDLELHIGDELNEGKGDFRSECVKCTCEVPPTLTCQRLTNEECSIKYPRNA